MTDDVIEKVAQIEARADAATDVPALTAALLAVLDRHADDGGGCCRECQFVWPCWTVRDIEEALR